jgi:pimeloyl-ACP methyl ester carboxylesterase
VGEVVFWIHGYTLDSSLWSELWQLLPGWCHVGVDLPGHGESASLRKGQTLASLGDELAAAALSVGAQHVIGLSLGSLIATQVALSRPDSFSTLCLGAPSLAGGPVDPGVGRRYKELEGLAAALGPGPWLRQVWMSSPPHLFTYAARHPALWGRLIEVVGRHRWEEFSGPGVAHLAAGAQAVPSLKSIKSRTLVLVGEHEFPAFRETARIIEADIPSCTVVELADTGHLCMLEATEESAGSIAAHLTP